MEKVDVTVQAPDGVRLAGTMVMPSRALRGAVVMVHGTGPMDRDENPVGGGGRLDVFNALAGALAAEGYASLRYDKRGCGQSAGDYWGHGQDELVGDVRACVDLLAMRMPGVPLFILGHSEGTIIAPRAAAGRRDVAGLLLICPFVTPMAEILRRQARGMAKELASAKGIGGWFSRAMVWPFGGIEAMQARLLGRLESSKAASFRLMGRKVTARSLRDLLALDNRAVHAGNGLPTLLLVAGKDVQCPPKDGEAIASLSKQAELVVIDHLTHILRRSDKAAGFGDYARQLKNPVDPVVGKTVTDWLDRRVGFAEDGPMAHPTV